MNSFISLFLAFLTFFASIVNTFTVVKAPEDTTEFTPVVRFTVCSDNHINTAGDTPCMRMSKMMKLSYAVADTDNEYNNLDAVMFVGDIADNGRKNQFYGMQSTLNACVKDETQVLTLLAARSHDGKGLNKSPFEFFTALTGNDSDTHVVINGFHFILLSASENVDEHYGEYQRTWLKTQLDAAVKDDPTKPIFVAHHEHVKNTVYGSSDFEGWGNSYFRDIFNQYPHIVHFSGHSHYPINDPRSIWQGEFTAIGTGSMKYLEFTIDDDRTVHPDGNGDEAEFWIVEVDANNRIRLRGYDLIEQQVLCEYIINSPLDRSYTPEKNIANSSAPVFKNANVKVSKSFGSYKITVDRAESTDGKPVTLYRAYALDKDGNELKMEYYLPRYYSATLDDTATINLGSVPKETTAFKIVAENAYGMQSKPIIVSK